VKPVRVALALLLTLGARCAIADVRDLEGAWEVTTTYPGGTSVARIEIQRTDDAYTARSGWLLPDFGAYTFTGKPDKDSLRLAASYAGSTSSIGDLQLKAERGALKGSGTLHGLAVSIAGRRPLERPANAPKVHDFEPRVFYRTLSGAHPPALRVFPGDTIRTSTVDAYGIDGKDQHRSPPGNPVTGPFYVEGAMPGDTVSIRFNEIKPNRRWATQYRATLSPKVMPPGYPQTAAPKWSDRWTLNLEAGTATPDAPGDRLADLSVRLQPMIGVVGVAPFWDQAVSSPDLGRWGGNLDYKELRAGTTVYFTVYQAGAMVFVGDGHALQGDGEITGQGLEISMDVDFTVDVIRGQPYLDQPWAENADYVMVSGVDGSVTSAMQAATSGLSRWLAQRYGLNDSEVATLLANGIQYDIAEVVDPHAHVVAKIRKDVLSRIRGPQTPGG
jgi:amidase